MPIIDVSAVRLLPKLPWFETDDEAIARLAMSQIAEFSGFTHVEYFSAVFKREAGSPPSRYRAQNRGRQGEAMGGGGGIG